MPAWRECGNWGTPARILEQSQNIPQKLRRSVECYSVAFLVLDLHSPGWSVLHMNRPAWKSLGTDNHLKQDMSHGRYLERTRDVGDLQDNSGLETSCIWWLTVPTIKNLPGLLQYLVELTCWKEILPCYPLGSGDRVDFMYWLDGHGPVVNCVCGYCCWHAVKFVLTGCLWW